MSVEIVEVGPRDGLQNERTEVSTADKLALIRRMIDAGARRIEVTSFVNPRRVPQMADAEAVAASLPARSDVTFIGLVLNQRGAERALAAPGIGELGAVCVSTDRFAVANQGQTSAESVDVAREIIRAARAAGRGGQATIAGSFGCPFEGEVDEDRVVAIAERLAEAEPREVALADTIGVAVPAAVSRLVARVREAIGPIPVRVHLHNTRNTGIANVSMLQIKVSLKGNCKVGLSLTTRLLCRLSMQPLLLVTTRLTSFVAGVRYLYFGFFTEKVSLPVPSSPRFQNQLFTKPYLAVVASVN